MQFQFSPQAQQLEAAMTETSSDEERTTSTAAGQEHSTRPFSCFVDTMIAVRALRTVLRRPDEGNSEADNGS